MADVITSNPQLITSVDTNVDHEVQFHPNFSPIIGDVVFIEVVSGTFKFCIGSPATNSSATYTAEKVAPLSFDNGNFTVHYVCTSAGTFRIAF